jgi:hypothetical protein
MMSEPSGECDAVVDVCPMGQYVVVPELCAGGDTDLWKCVCLENDAPACDQAELGCVNGFAHLCWNDQLVVAECPNDCVEQGGMVTECF